MSRNVALSIGTSLGNKLIGHNHDNAQQRLQAIVDHLSESNWIHLLNCSATYLTRAWGNPRAGCYLNATLNVQSSLPPGTLLRRLLQLEFKHGRRRQRLRWNKRCLDIDILLYGQQTINSKTLITPHRWMWQRDFVLYPLASNPQSIAHSWQRRVQRSRLSMPKPVLTRPKPIAALIIDQPNINESL